MMFNHMPTLLLIVLVFQIMSRKSKGTSTSSEILRAEIQSCKGCALNRLYGVRNFVNHDLQKYKWAKFRSIPGASPELVLFNKQNKEVERISLAPYTREQCNSLMERFGRIVIGERKTDL